jgi:coenzyme F420 hydrogenase subunit beta
LNEKKKMHNMTPTERLYAIVEQGHCIGCGICQAVAGKYRVIVKKTESGYLQPIVTGDLDHDTVDQIYDVCPGTRIDGLPEEAVDADTKHDNVWGPWRRMVRNWAGDPEIRYEGSTGGVMTALGTHLLKAGLVDFVLHTRTSSTEPSFGESTLSFNTDDIFEAAGSRYGPTATLINIDEVLDRNQNFAFIGKPCDIAALRNYARHDKRVNQQVKYWLSLVCGGFGTPDTTRAFFRRMGIEPESVEKLRYRGKGCPGPTRVETADRVEEAHYLDFWGEDATMWGLPFRCKICPDGIGDAADIAVADCWPGGSPTRQESIDDPGTNACVVRTQAGEALLESAYQSGDLVHEHDVTPDDMSIYQPHQMHKKYAVWSRYQGLADCDQIVPVTHRLRLEELAAELPDATKHFQREGTRQRVAAGKTKVPTPVTAK